MNADELSQESTASRVVRFAEWLAEKLANGKAVQAFEEECFVPRKKMSKEEAAKRYSLVLADYRKGVAISTACRRHKADKSAFHNWMRRNGISK